MVQLSIFVVVFLHEAQRINVSFDFHQALVAQGLRLKFTWQQENHHPDEPAGVYPKVCASHFLKGLYAITESSAVQRKREIIQELQQILGKPEIHLQPIEITHRICPVCRKGTMTTVMVFSGRKPNNSYRPPISQKLTSIPIG